MGRTRQFYVYILSSRSGTLYIGMTNDLRRRIWEHKNKLLGGFSTQYAVDRLLYWEEFVDARNAIAREKQLKGWRRERKVRLFEQTNPRWEDLSKDWFLS